MLVWDYISKKLRAGLTLHMTLLDPDKQSPAEAGEMACAAAEAGSDAIMVGGSTALCQETLDETIRSIKDRCDIPVIIFPTAASCLSRFADAIYFMSMLNSKSLDFLIGEHKKGAVVIRELGLEPISMGYVVVEPGMKVAEVGKADLVGRNAYDDARAYALVAEYFGMKLVYLEAGSGAPEHVTPEMVSAVSSTVSIPVVVGGGIRTPEAAAALTAAGADVIVTGTLVEETGDIRPTLTRLISAIREVSDSEQDDS